MCRDFLFGCKNEISFVQGDGFDLQSPMEIGSKMKFPRTREGAWHANFHSPDSSTEPCIPRNVEYSQTLTKN